MSTISPKTVKFPNQETIMAYISTHPLKEHAIDTNYIEKSFPNSLLKVANYFANKEMPFNQIRENVKEALKRDDDKKLDNLVIALQKFVLSCEEKDASNDFTLSMKNILSEAKSGNEDLNIAISIYAHALKDLIEGAIYIPPKGGETVWTRQVTQVYNQQ